MPIPCRSAPRTYAWVMTRTLMASSLRPPAWCRHARTLRHSATRPRPRISQKARYRRRRNSRRSTRPSIAIGIKGKPSSPDTHFGRRDYGDVHDGEAVLIFVTEDFLPKLQVKQEVSDAPDAISVLKLNGYRRFYTGIYPYTVMTSSFTPLVWRAHAQAQQHRSRVGAVRSTARSIAVPMGLHALSHSYFEREAGSEDGASGRAVGRRFVGAAPYRPQRSLRGEAGPRTGARLHSHAPQSVAPLSSRRRASGPGRDGPRRSSSGSARGGLSSARSKAHHLLRAELSARDPGLGRNRRTVPARPPTRTNAIMDAYWEHKRGG